MKRVLVAAGVIVLAGGVALVALVIVSAVVAPSAGVRASGWDDVWVTAGLVAAIASAFAAPLLWLGLRRE